jgi:DNA-directed RNA polymerase
VPLDKRRRELVEEEQKMVCKFSNQLEWRVPQSDTKLILMHSDKFMCVAQKIIVHHNPFALDWVCGYIKWAAHQSLQLVPCYVLRVHVSFLWGIDSVISHVASSWMFCSGWNSL